MGNKYKYVLLYFIFVVVLILILIGVDKLKDKNISLEDEILVNQAQIHFQNQVNTRSWSAQHGGVYVKPSNGLKPNQYLQNNTLEAVDGTTLIKINPAWMTRQLSELSNTSGFSFRITSLKPLNPINKPDEFEVRALKYLEKNKAKEYFELDEDFRYMGALETKQSCLNCHAEQGYKVGDIRGGISISLDLSDHRNVVEYIQSRALYGKILLVFLLSSIVLLIHKQMKDNENLEMEVLKQTREIQSTKKLLQEVLDTDRSFMMVSDSQKLIFGNKTMLDFFNVKTIEEFLEKYQHLSNFFIENEGDEYLCATMNGEHWIPYLHREQENKDIKVLMYKDEGVRCFRPHLKEFKIDNENLNVIIFNDVTDELEKINSLEKKASTDALTNLFNRGKFSDVLFKEIELAKSTYSPLSLIFLDIDHFKVVNDTYGHDAGDIVLVELAKILENTVREGDFVARWGGEEFVITLQVTKAKNAQILAEKIRKNVQEYNFTEGGKQTISLGVTEYKQGESEDNFIKRVDEALYEAKQTGRNKTVIR